MCFRLSKGFTLIELLVVISIIGVLSSVVLSATIKLKGTSVDSKNLVQFRQLEKAIELYFSDYGYYPNFRTSTTDLIGCPNEGNAHWCAFQAALAPYISLNKFNWDYSPYDSSFGFFYTSNLGDNYKSYGMFLSNPNNPSFAKIAANDNGIWPQFYEIGPQVSYCKNKYLSYPNWDWTNNSNNVCYGGN